ncbi:hypothetical protein [Mesorhizobium sp. M0643]|uniref:hypothetical protein n=1 Tax=Mesorhizobium sp. M0643 TaxID=2956978 RepID=UPI003334E8B2
MSKVIPTEGQAFDEMMRAIDLELISQQLPIPHRPSKAISIVARKFNVPIPIGGTLPKGMDPELARYAPLGASINNWYRTTYGNRIKIEMSPGLIVVLLEGDLWSMRFPVVYGSVRFVTSRTITGRTTAIGSGQIEYNVVESLKDISPAKAASLSDASLQYISSAL